MCLHSLRTAFPPMPGMPHVQTASHSWDLSLTYLVSWLQQEAKCACLIDGGSDRSNSVRGSTQWPCLVPLVHMQLLECCSHGSEAVDYVSVCTWLTFDCPARGIMPWHRYGRPMLECLW